MIAQVCHGRVSGSRWDAPRTVTMRPCGAAAAYRRAFSPSWSNWPRTTSTGQVTAASSSGAPASHDRRPRRPHPVEPVAVRADRLEHLRRGHPLQHPVVERGDPLAARLLGDDPEQRVCRRPRPPRDCRRTDRHEARQARGVCRGIRHRDIAAEAVASKDDGLPWNGSVDRRGDCGDCGVHGEVLGCAAAVARQVRRDDVELGLQPSAVRGPLDPTHPRAVNENEPGSHSSTLTGGSATEGAIPAPG